MAQIWVNKSIYRYLNNVFDIHFKMLPTFVPIQYFSFYSGNELYSDSKQNCR